MPTRYGNESADITEIETRITTHKCKQHGKNADFLFLSKIGWMPREIHRLRPHTDQPNARKSANLETETTQAYPPPYVKVRKLPNEVAINLERETREAEGG